MAPGEKVRTVTTPSGHRVRLAFPPGRRRRGAGRVVSVLHPNHESRCGDVKVRFVGASTAEGQRLLGNPGVRSWHGVRYTVNPSDNPPEAPTLIYPRVEEIRAVKSDGQPYYHPFEKGAKDYGIPDGYQLVSPSGKTYNLANGSFVVTSKLAEA